MMIFFCHFSVFHIYFILCNISPNLCTILQCLLIPTSVLIMLSFVNILHHLLVINVDVYDTA
jgi:hypothetical protein